MVLLPELEQLKLHWEGAPEVIKFRAQQEPGKDKKTVTALNSDMGSFSDSPKITQMVLIPRIRPTKPSNTSGLFIEDYSPFRSLF